MILHRDDRCVVVDKPSGTVVHASDFVGDTEGVPLLQQVRNLVGQHVYPVHRLDRGASGIVLFALDRVAAGAFSAAWPTADKRYLAITRGHPPPHTLLEHPVPRAPGEERVDATTEIWLRETFGRYALVEARPHTGRLHQIRRHLKHMSCPLIGDVRYGKGEHNRIFRTEHRLHRLALHSIRLIVTHPAGTTLTVECPLAPDIAHAVESARAAYATIP